MSLERPNPTIVVGFDGSPAALAAVDHAIDRALPDGRLVLVHAYSVPVDYAAASYYAEMQVDAARCAETVLDDLELDCERLVTIEHHRDITVGPAAPAIIRAAEANDADEIVIGSRGLGRVRALLGSVAHDVIHRAQCPVTVIPERVVALRAAPPLVHISVRPLRLATPCERLQDLLANPERDHAPAGEGELSRGPRRRPARRSRSSSSTSRPPPTRRAPTPVLARWRRDRGAAGRFADRC
jgi:nucleotide-binding universal stress UspA family protein